MKFLPHLHLPITVFGWRAAFLSSGGQTLPFLQVARNICLSPKRLLPIPKEGLELSEPDVCALPSCFAQITFTYLRLFKTAKQLKILNGTFINDQIRIQDILYVLIQMIWKDKSIRLKAVLEECRNGVPQ